VPAKKYYKALAEEQGGFEVWVGMRSEESHERAKRYAGKVCEEVYPPHEVMPSSFPQYLHKLGVSFRLAILDWATADVFEYLAGEENPLYSDGFDRVGCFPCLAGGDRWKENAFNFDSFGAEQRVKVASMEAVIGRSVFNSGASRMRDATGCLICAI